jgi:hypothetical protein
MKRIILGAIVSGALLAALPGSAMAAKPASTPADGQCVATGVKTLGPGAIKAAATGQLPVSLSFVIQDHAFNGADATEGLLGFTICE